MDINLKKYIELPFKLRRYSFESKMSICFEYSKKIMSPYGLVDNEILKNLPLPWDLEIFALLSVISNKEYTSSNSWGYQDRKFLEIINIIKDIELPNMYEGNLVSNFAITSGQTQFKIQENVMIKLYRYNYIFGFVNNVLDMPEIIKSKFGINYNTMLEFALLNQFMYSTLDSLKSLLKFSNKEFCECLKCISLERDLFIKKQSIISENILEYKYCLRVLQSFPVIIDNSKYYCPTPHLLLDACTSSLIFRLTDGNQDLRSKIGKEILEKYIYKLFFDTKIYSEVIDEKPYNGKGKGNELTPDVMIRYNDYFLLVESKFITPSIKSRLLDNEVIHKTLNRISEAVKQIYRHVTKEFGHKYNFFNSEIYVDSNNIFGIVIIFDDTYILREKIYKDVAFQLNISIDSYEFKFLCNHIKIMTLYNLESLLLFNQNIVNILIHQIENSNKVNDLFISTLRIDTDKNLNQEIENFKDEAFTKLRKIVEEGNLFK